VIEEIQLEPIPEYLSNQRMDKKRKPDNSMLLLDEDQLSDRDLPGMDCHPNVKNGKKKE